MTSVAKKPGFLINSLTSYLPYAVDFVLKIVVIRMILLHLGQEMLGVWGILKAAVIFPAFLQSGLSTAIFLQSSRKSSPTNSSSLADALTVSFIFSIVIGLALAVGATHLVSFFRIPSAYISLATSAFRISGATFVVASIANVFRETLQGRGRFDVANVLTAATSLVNSGVSILLLTHGRTILALILVDFLTSALFLVATMLSCKFFISESKILYAPNRAGLRSLTRETSFQLVYALLDRVLWELDALLIAPIFGISQMAFYWAGQRLTYAWKGLLWAGSWPAVLEAADEPEQISGRLQKIHWMQVGLAIPMAVTLLYYSADIVRIWTSNENASTVLVLRLLTVAVLIDFFPATYVSLLFARARIGTLTRLLSVGLLIKLVLVILAWYRQDFRLMIWSTTAGAATFSLLVMLSASEKKTSQLLQFWKPAIPALIGSLIGTLVFPSTHFRPANWNQMVGLAAAFFLLCLVLTATLMAILLRRENKTLLWLISTS